MRLNINNEGAYMHYFEQLADIENLHAKNDILSLMNFIILPLNQLSKKGKTKGKATKKKENDCHDSPETLSNKRAATNNVDSILYTLRPDILEKRRKLLDNLQDSFKDENTCKDCVNKLLEFEESVFQKTTT